MRPDVKRTCGAASGTGRPNRRRAERQAGRPPPHSDLAAVWGKISESCISREFHCSRYVLLHRQKNKELRQFCLSTAGCFSLTLIPPQMFS